MDKEWAPNIDKPKNGFDVTLHTEDADQARRWFDALKEGGKMVMDFARPSGRRASAACRPVRSAVDGEHCSRRRLEAGKRGLTACKGRSSVKGHRLR